MQTVNKLMMFAMNVSDMTKAKAFYVDTIDLKVATDYRKDDDNWWVTLTFPEGGATITLARTTGFETVKPGTMTLYFETADISTAYKDLSEKGVKVSEVKDDLFGPGSGVKFIGIEDPDGNQIILAQAHEPRIPF